MKQKKSGVSVKEDKGKRTTAKAQRNEIMLPFHSLLSFHFIIFHSFGLLPTA